MPVGRAWGLGRRVLGAAAAAGRPSRARARPHTLPPRAAPGPHPRAQGGSEPGDFDARGAGARCVVRDIDSKRFLMFYEGVGADGTRAIGVAVSDDGLRGWRRCPRPVLEGSGEGGEGGAGGAWDGGDVGCPWAVSMAGGRWRLYYSGRPQRGGGAWRGIGMARSVEGAPLFEGAAPQQFRRYAPKAQ